MGRLFTNTDNKSKGQLLRKELYMSFYGQFVLSQIKDYERGQIVKDVKVGKDIRSSVEL